MDVDIVLLVNSRGLIKDHCIARMCSMKRGGRWPTSIFKWWPRGNFLVFQCWTWISTFVWDRMRVLWHVMLSRARSWRMKVCIPSRAWSGIVWMTMDRRNKYMFVHRNVLAKDSNHNKMKYAKFGKVGVNNRASISHSNNSQRARPQRAQLCMKKHLRVTLTNNSLHKCKNWQFYPKSNPRHSI